MKILSAVNLTHKNFGLSRPKIDCYASLTAVIGNFRKLIRSLGYDCSLLNDEEVLAFESFIYEYEHGDRESLIELLDFLVDTTVQ
jgi:hypothetical protein